MLLIESISRSVYSLIVANLLLQSTYVKLKEYLKLVNKYARITVDTPQTNQI